jgi:hypothetical protein
MLTRSQTKKQGSEIGVYIDFDDSSRAWMQNKRKTGGGCYEYILSKKNVLRRSDRISRNDKYV